MFCARLGAGQTCKICSIKNSNVGKKESHNQLDFMGLCGIQAVGFCFFLLLTHFALFVSSFHLLNLHSFIVILVRLSFLSSVLFACCMLLRVRTKRLIMK